MAENHLQPLEKKYGVDREKIKKINRSLGLYMTEGKGFHDLL